MFVFFSFYVFFNIAASWRNKVYKGVWPWPRGPHFKFWDPLTNFETAEDKTLQIPYDSQIDHNKYYRNYID